jgi:hypothetical protein
MLFYFKFKYYNPKDFLSKSGRDYDPSNFFDFLLLNIKSTLNNQKIINVDKIRFCTRKDFESV